MLLVDTFMVFATPSLSLFLSASRTYVFLDTAEATVCVCVCVGGDSGWTLDPSEGSWGNISELHGIVSPGIKTATREKTNKKTFQTLSDSI